MATSAIIATCALAFTVGSFWWLQARKGRLVSCEPQTYSGYFRAGDFRLRLPLTIYNTGARTLVVTDLRAIFIDSEIAAPVISFRRTLRPAIDDIADFAHPFPVPGRQTVSKFVEFGRKDWAPRRPATHTLRVEARVGRDEKWGELVVVDLVSPGDDTAGSYITHRRDPTDDAPPISSWSPSN